MIVVDTLLWDDKKKRILITKKCKKCKKLTAITWNFQVATTPKPDSKFLCPTCLKTHLR